MLCTSIIFIFSQEFPNGDGTSNPRIPGYIPLYITSHTLTLVVLHAKTAIPQTGHFYNQLEKYSFEFSLLAFTVYTDPLLRNVRMMVMPCHDQTARPRAQLSKAPDFSAAACCGLTRLHQPFFRAFFSFTATQHKSQEMTDQERAQTKEKVLIGASSIRGKINKKKN
jgi:hypothetical protein